MTTLEQMYQKAQQFANEVETAILANEFDFMRAGEQTCTIRIDGVELQIWIANHESFTKIYRVNHTRYDESYIPKHTFSNPRRIRAILLYGNSQNSMEETEEEHF